MEEYEGEEPYCPYCKKSLSWDQFKELWVCREHGKFSDSQVIRHVEEESQRKIYQFTYIFSCDEDQDPADCLEQEFYDIISNADRIADYGEIEVLQNEG